MAPPSDSLKPTTFAHSSANNQTLASGGAFKGDSAKIDDNGAAASESAPGAAADGRKIIFLHIPKTAGTTLNRIIDWEYNPLRIYSINGRYFRESYRKLVEYPPSRLPGMKVFRGHMPFGLHRLLNGPSTYIVVLRDPVERAMSLYFFAANRRIHRHHSEVSRQTLEEYVRTSPYNNAQTKLIAGQSRERDFIAGECNDAMLSAAKENLSRYFTLIGITERFEETLALAKVLLGWKIDRWATFRVTPHRPKKEAIGADTRALIAQYNSFDVALYQYASELFSEKVAENQEEVAAERESIRRAKLNDGFEFFYYRTVSSALKNISLVNSALTTGVSWGRGA